MATGASAALLVTIPSPIAGPTRVSFSQSSGEQGDLVLTVNNDTGPLLASNWSSIVSAVASALTSAGADNVTTDTVTVT